MLCEALVTGLEKCEWVLSVRIGLSLHGSPFMKQRKICKDKLVLHSRKLRSLRRRRRMNQWQDLIVGTLEVAPEVQVFVNIVGALFLLEIALSVVSFLGGIGRR